MRFNDLICNDENYFSLFKNKRHAYVFFIDQHTLPSSVLSLSARKHRIDTIHERTERNTMSEICLLGRHPQGQFRSIGFPKKVLRKKDFSPPDVSPYKNRLNGPGIGFSYLVALFLLQCVQR